MRKETRIHNRLLAVILTLLMIIAMFPAGVISASAATEGHPDEFTITVKDSEGNPIEGAKIEYTVNKDEENKKETATGSDGVAVIDELKDRDFPGPGDPQETLDAVVSKLGYDDYTIDEELTETNGNIDVVMTAKDIVTVTIKVSDSVEESSISDADVKIDGYHTVEGKTDSSGEFEAALYINEPYSISVEKKGYKPFTTEDTVKFIEEKAFDVALVEKQIDDTFRFDTETPDDLVYGGTFTNTASAENSSGSITYSVQSGDSVSVDSDGAVTTLKAGTSTVKAVLAEDEDYQGAEITYQITVTNAPDSGFAFTTPNPAAIKYKENGTYTNNADGGKGTGAVTYAVTDGTDVATVSKTTGVLSIKKAGTVTVTATRAADDQYAAISASYTLKIELADQADLAFEIPSPADQVITGKTFRNEAKGGSGSGEITYSITEGKDCAEIEDASSPVVTFKKVGKVTVKVEKAGDDRYMPASKTYSFTIVKDTQKTRFETSELTVDYAPSLTVTNPIVGEGGTGAVTYEIKSGNDAAEIDEYGTLTIKKASSGVIVQATKAGDDEYESNTIQFKLIINKAKQTGFAFEKGGDATQTWAPDATYTNAASGGQSTGAVTYTAEISKMSSDDPCAVFDSDTATVTMNGGGTVTVKAVKAGDDCYKPAEAEYTLTIEKANQQGFKFKEGIASQYTYNDNNNEIALGTEGGNGEGDVTYSVTYGPDVLSVSGSTAKILKSGDAKITAHKAATDQYFEAAAALNVTVKKANQIISFKDHETSTIIYGNEFQNEAVPVVVDNAPDGKGYASGTEITYSVSEGKDIVSVDKDGKLTFKNNKTGKIVIEAFKEGDECYNDTADSYTLNVKFAETPETSYLLECDQPIHNGWYTDDVIIKPAEGYQISYSNNLSGNEWADQLKVTTEGKNGKTVYLKNEEGISGAIVIPEDDIRIDRTPPKELSISFSKSVLDTILSAVTFGFYQEPVIVTLTAVDETSHIDAFEVTYGGETTVINCENMSFDESGTKATAGVTIPAQFRDTVSFKAFDTAGNFSNASDDKVIVVDNIAPGLTVGFDNNNVSNNTYYNADRTATITIDEANFFVEAFEKAKDYNENPVKQIDEHLVITVTKVDNKGNSEKKTYKNADLTTPFTKDENGKWTATLLFDEDADYTLTINYKDFSGNEIEPYTTAFTIDKTQPEISVSYDNNDAQNNNYYKNVRSATFTVVEHNFHPSDIVVNVISAKDVQGEDVNTAKDYQELLRSGTWTDDGDVHTFSVPFDVNANYEFEVFCSDLAGNGQVAPAADVFTVDKTAPTDLKIDYSTSVLDTILNAVTFGFYNESATVTISADDITSGVDFFTYSYGVQEGASSVNIGESNVVIARDNIEFSDNGKIASAKFTIPAQFRGTVSFTATDMAGNESEQFNDDKVIVVDQIAPGVTVTYDNNNPSNGKYYNADRTATITIDEANFFGEAFETIDNIAVDPAEAIDEHLVITVKKTDNDNKTMTKIVKSADLTTPFEKDPESDKWTATLLFDEDADYTWSISYKDFSGNGPATYNASFTIDKISPVMSVKYDNNDHLNDDHYKADRTATIKITEHNFRPADIVVDTITAVDIQGNPVDYAKDYQKMLREGEWEKSGNTYSIKIPFDVDARYNYKISYSDLAANEEEVSVSDEFCIDKVSPSELKATYSTSVLDTFLGSLTLGFYQAPATVTIEADDGTSGVDYFTYSYTVTEGESDINKGKTNIVIPTDEITYSDTGKHAKAEFVIDAQFRGMISFTATDRAGNVSETYGDGKTVIVDDETNGITVTYDNNSATYDTYYDKPRTATIKIHESNFFDDAFEKVENTAVDPAVMIDEHLEITVTEVDNDGNSTTTEVKSDDLTTKFVKSEEDKDTWQATLLFDKDADYSWSIKYKDFSGNKADSFSDAFTVDNTDPVIDVAFNNNSAKNEKYFKANRPATVTITEHNFNARDVVVSVQGKRATGKIADYQAYLSNPNNWTRSGNVYTADILFDTEAYYTFGISYADMAGRMNQGVNYGESVAPTDFVIDKTAPTQADITIGKESVLAKNGVAFEKFYQSTAEVKFSANFDIAEKDNITYQKVDSLAAYSANASWTPFDGSVKVSPNEKFIIYFRAEDKAGNVTIVNSTGIVVDDKAPEGERYAPDIDIEPEAANENGLHNSDVDVDLTVVDPPFVGNSKSANGYYSGIRKIAYRIYTLDTEASEQGVLLDINNGLKSGAVYDKDNLVSKWTGQITVKASTFNSNNVIVEVTATDNAGNERVTTNEMISKPIRIDVTAPTISVSYQDGSDNGDDTFSDSTNGAYFKNNRTATIVITERNFDADKVKITATKDGQTYDPGLSSWSTSTGGGNGDGTTHTATITYSSDGIYTFDISFIDQADNENEPVEYSGLSPRLFTVDKTNPVFSISYDNNNAQNGNYYKEQRTATLTIEERNFEESRINISMTANDNGSPVRTPGVNGWSTSGDTHTATITCSADALYEFDIEYNDKAGNPLSEDFQRDSFYVDQTKPKVSIQKIVDKSANNDSGNIGYIITATDTNFDVFTPKLTAIVKEGNKFVIKELDVGSMSNVSNGRMYIVTNLPDDGVYRITCTVVDKAGNAYEDVTLSKDREDRETYTEKRSGNDTLLTFSVNREGSTFNLDDNTINLLSRYYVQQVDDNVVIDEINVDTLNQKQVSINGRELAESEYGFEQSGGDEENWYRYQYTIDRTLFADEGEYNVVVSSKDRATNDAFSDVKDAGIEFVVDRTAPVVTITGLANDGRYQTESQMVTAVPTDDGGALKSIVVTLVGKDGKEDKELLNLSDDNFMKALEEGDGKVTFEVPEGLYQDVRIICDDQAFYGDHENVIFDEVFTNISVTPSAFLIFWANKPLRYAVIGGVVLLIAGIGVLIFLKKRKKNASVTK